MSRAGRSPARVHSDSDRSRRRFLRTGATLLGGAAAVALGACGGGGGAGVVEPLTVSSVPGNDPDVDLLNGALVLEQSAIALYAASTKVLQGRDLALGRKLLAQEMQHADVLSQELTQLGGTPAQPHSDYTGKVGRLSDRASTLRAALLVEQRQIDNYIGAVATLARSELRAVVAAVLTDQAEHVALLRGALAQPALAVLARTGAA